MPRMAAKAAFDDFLAGHIGQLLVRQPQAKAYEPAQSSSEARGAISPVAPSVSDTHTAKPLSTVSGSSTVGRDQIRRESALLDDDASEQFESLSLAHQRSNSSRTSFSTSFGAAPRRTSISNARCFSIASESTHSYFDHHRRRSLRSSRNSQASTADTSPPLPSDQSDIKWTLPFENKSSAFDDDKTIGHQPSKLSRRSCPDVTAANDVEAVACSHTKPKSTSFSGPCPSQQRPHLAELQTPNLVSPPLLSPPLSICSSVDAGPSARSVKSSSSHRSSRRGLSLVPKANDGRTFTFVELSSDSEQSDLDSLAKSADIPSQDGSPVSVPLSPPAAVSPFTAIVDPESKPSSRKEVPSTPASKLTSPQEASLRSARTVTFATATSQSTDMASAQPAAGRVGRTRKINILPRDPNKQTLLERTMANERARRQSSVDQTTLRNERAMTKSQSDADSRNSDPARATLELATRTSSGSDGDTGNDQRANSGAQTEVKPPKSNERTTDWARDQTRFTRPHTSPSQPNDNETPSSGSDVDEDPLALPQASASARQVRPTIARDPLSNSHSSYSMSSTSPSSDMQDFRTPPSETYTALSSPMFDLEQPVVSSATNSKLTALADNASINLTAAVPAA